MTFLWLRSIGLGLQSVGLIIMDKINIAKLQQRVSLDLHLEIAVVYGLGLEIR